VAAALAVLGRPTGPGGGGYGLRAAGVVTGPARGGGVFACQFPLGLASSHAAELALASCRETPSCRARLIAVANFGMNATSCSQLLRDHSCYWPVYLSIGR
jgi:hypothetical protein